MKANKEIATVIKSLVEMGEKDQGDDYFEIVRALALIFPRELREQLQQLVNGPIWDGDIICKSHRGWLFDMGLAMRVCCKGEQGFTGAKYIGYSILKKMKEIKLAEENVSRAADYLSPLSEPNPSFTKEQNAKIDAHIVQSETES